MVSEITVEVFTSCRKTHEDNRSTSVIFPSKSRLRKNALACCFRHRKNRRLLVTSRLALLAHQIPCQCPQGTHGQTTPFCYCKVFPPPLNAPLSSTPRPQGSDGSSSNTHWPGQQVRRPRTLVQGQQASLPRVFGQLVPPWLLPSCLMSFVAGVLITP